MLRVSNIVLKFYQQQTLDETIYGRRFKMNMLHNKHKGDEGFHQQHSQVNREKNEREQVDTRHNSFYYMESRWKRIKFWSYLF